MGASFLGMVSCQQGPDTLIRKNPGALGYGGDTLPPRGKRAECITRAKPEGPESCIAKP